MWTYIKTKLKKIMSLNQEADRQHLPVNSVQRNREWNVLCFRPLIKLSVLHNVSSSSSDSLKGVLTHQISWRIWVWGSLFFFSRGHATFTLVSTSITEVENVMILHCLAHSILLGIKWFCWKEGQMWLCKMFLHLQQVIALFYASNSWLKFHVNSVGE